MMRMMKRAAVGILAAAEASWSAWLGLMNSQKQNAPLTKIRRADIMSIEKVLTGKRLAPYQSEIKKKMTVSLGKREAVIFSCVYHRRETQSM